MKVGVILPTFSADASAALALAAEAERAGIDGVFAYDHIWPMGSPGRPALAPFPLLAAIASRHPKLVVAPLVSRVSLAEPERIAERFATLEKIAPGRVIAALGTGDSLSLDEEIALGLPSLSATDRRDRLRQVIELLPDHVEKWCGGGGEATNLIAREYHMTLNLWNASPMELAQAAADGPICWAGSKPGNMADSLRSYAEAGATWSVVAGTVSLEVLAGLKG
jgi:alkanesulfonate monooxygenase SsuD/methylene tetrahydromethanopterin reductase-like flavin-dependent oxidoreductase (luciferase family)